MFDVIDCILNASRGLSAIAEFLVHLVGDMQWLPIIVVLNAFLLIFSNKFDLISVICNDARSF